MLTSTGTVNFTISSDSIGHFLPLTFFLNPVKKKGLEHYHLGALNSVFYLANLCMREM